MKQFLISQTQ